MAYIAASLQTAESAASTTYTVNLPPHTAGDLLLVLVVQDGGGTTIAPPSGWTIIGTQAQVGSTRGLWAYKVAESSSETNPELSGANDEWAGLAITVKDADETTPIGTTSGADFLRTDISTVSTSWEMGALTTGTDECLVLYSCTYDFPMSGYVNSSDVTVLDRSANSNAGLIVAYTQMQSAGAAPQPTFLFTNSDAGSLWAIAVRNKLNGSLQPMARITNREVINYYGNFGTAHSSPLSWQAPSTFATAINGINCTSVSASVSSNSSAAGWSYGNSHAISTAEITEGQWAGAWHEIDETDFTGKLFAIAHVLGTGVPVSSEGHIIAFTDGTNWAAFNIWRKGMRQLSPNVFFIDCVNATPYASSGSINWGGITGIGYFYHRVSAGTSAVLNYIRSAELWEGPLILTGGGPGRPATMSDFINGINAAWGLNPQYSLIAGIGQCLTSLPVQIGDGTNKTYFSSSGISLEFPKTFTLSSVEQQNNWNVPAGGVSIKVKAGESDTVSLASSIMQTQVEFDFTLDPTSSTSAAYDFSGWSCIGFDPEWKTGIACNSAIFASCAEIDGKAATFSSCIFKQAKETHALALDAGASVAGSSFIKGSDTYALKLREAGTYTLNGATFTGYTTPIKITATTGVVTLTLAAGQAEPAYSSDGAAVVYEQPQQTITVLGLATGSRVKISRVDTGEIIYTGVESDGHIVTPAITYNGLVEIEVRNASGTPAYKPWVTRTTMSGSSVSLTATQEVD